MRLERRSWRGNSRLRLSLKTRGLLAFWFGCSSYAMIYDNDYHAQLQGYACPRSSVRLQCHVPRNASLFLSI
jgi:hypothetical protein